MEKQLKEHLDKLKEYKHLCSYYEDYVLNKNVKPGMLPNLIVWIRRSVNDDCELAAEIFCMTEHETDDFLSWGHNSRWANTFAYVLDEKLKEDFAKGTTKVIDILLYLAEESGDIEIK